jgi:PAT family beta-lactamase induction signal transducer AmpG
MADSAGAANPEPGNWFQQALTVLGRRKTLSMLVFGFTAGLPNVLLIGTLNFWLAKAQVDLATIGVLSWIGLAYAFKFLWSPAMNLMPPFPFRMLGRRRGWILICQAIITICIAIIATTDPTKGLGVLALAAAIAALASATQDISIDTWRIEEADKATPVDLLSAVYQFGYRSATLAGGAGALFLASVASWNTTYMVAAGVFLIASLATLAAPESPIRDAETATAKTHRVGPKVRLYAVAAVLVAWAWAAYEIISFMIAAVTTTPAPSASSFTQTYGPWIVVATVVFPCALAAWLANTKITSTAGDVPSGFMAHQADRLYVAIVEPLVELMGRLGLASLIVLLVILSYRITDSIWGPFAGPFYLTELKYTEAEIALASKIWGVAMTIAGVALGAISLLWLGRMASVFIGAVAAAVTNLLYADLALGGVYVNAFLNGTGLMHLFGLFGLDDRMARLMAAIAGENIAAGFAGAAFVAYLSSLASRLHGAVQFAVFTSLTMLIGTLGRGALGDMIKSDGYAPVFVFTMWLGAIAIVACLIEWVRQARAEKEA